MYKKILVPLDGSVLAEKAIPHAAALAKGTGAEVTLVTVVQLTFGVAGAKLEAMPEFAAERRAALAGEAMVYLQKIQKGLTDQGVVAKTVALEGDIASEIINYAEKNDFDLIAMATHGRSGVKRFVMGSVAEKVSRSAGKPVLLIRALQ
jgi:nucleotide-binding universal stress UspA family protein